MFYGEKTERLNYIFSITLCMIRIQFRNFLTNFPVQVTSECDSGNLYVFPIHVLQKDKHEESLEHRDDRALNNSSHH